MSALMYAHRGDVQRAREIARQGMEVAERTGNLLHQIRCVALLGFIDLSVGDPTNARDWLEWATELAAAALHGDPGVLRFAADAVEALLGAGDLDGAETRLEILEQRGEALGRAWALATAGRCRGLIESARGNSAAAEVALEQALERHASVPQPMERGRTLLALGTVHRRAKRKLAARHALDEAGGTFRDLGTPLWEAKVAAEFQRIGGRPPAPHSLTPTERQVAGLVAAGRTNREISEQAFMSVKTVEAHLTRIYSKLEVRSRTELARAVGSDYLTLGNDATR
jgi:DNA-binding NarL/FixJ family response regulator